MCAYNVGLFSRDLLAFFAVTPKHESVGQAENTRMVFFKWNVYASRFFSKNDGAMDCPTALQLPVFGQQSLNTVL